jgi:YebC/PmpR family DNA-binding regulatory protein
MAGHSKWAQIKRAKGANDAKRGQLFSKLAKEVTIAARIGNSDDPSLNARLRMVLLKCKNANMPNDIIQRALKKATAAESGAIHYEELPYEIFGPGGVAIFCEVQTDNRNRTAAEIRLILNRNGGQMATSGAVTRLFERKGQILIKADVMSEERMMEVAIEAGAQDMIRDDDVYEIICDPSDFDAVHEKFEELQIPMEVAHVTFLPNMQTEVDDEVTEAIQKLVDALEENEDVKDVYTTAQLS